MKRKIHKAIVAASLLAGAASAWAQGLLNWCDYQIYYGSLGNYYFSISIISPSPTNPTVEQTGNIIANYPPGLTDYSGGLIGGNVPPPGEGVGDTPANGPGGYNYQLNGNFEVGLYVATDPSALTADILGGNARGHHRYSSNYCRRLRQFKWH
jgi:hypothetical protein